MLYNIKIIIIIINFTSTESIPINYMGLFYRLKKKKKPIGRYIIIFSELNGYFDLPSTGH